MSNPRESASRITDRTDAIRLIWRFMAGFLMSGLVLASLAACGSSATGARAPGSAEASTQPIPSTDQSLLEQEYGVRITRVVVTSAGGMVDLRYEVLDAGKAKNFSDKEQKIAPSIIPAGADLTIAVPGMMDETELEAGKGYYILYANAYGAVKPGGTVIIQIGDVRVSHPVEP